MAGAAGIGGATIGGATTGAARSTAISRLRGGHRDGVVAGQLQGDEQLLEACHREETVESPPTVVLVATTSA